MPRIRGDQITDGTITGADLQDLSVLREDLEDGIIDNSKIDDNAAISQSKIDQTSGWISNLEATATAISNIDTTSGDVDGSTQQPSNPSDGDRWLVKNTGSSGNVVNNLPWDVELRDGMFMEFVATGGSFYPTFSNYNQTKMDWVEKWSGSQGSVTNTWGDGVFLVTGSGYSYGWTMLIDTTNPASNIAYMSGLVSTSSDNQARVKYENGNFMSVVSGTWSNDLLYSIKKWEESTYAPSTAPITDGWKEIWSGNDVSINMTLADGYYRIKWHLTPTSEYIRTSNMEVDSSQGNIAEAESHAQGSDTANVRYSTASTPIIDIQKYGNWTSNDARIMRIEKWEGIMTVRHDYKQITSGVSFPVGPQLGDECYRTDLDEWFKYNGTVWTQF